MMTLEARLQLLRQENARLKSYHKMLRDRLEELLEVHSFIDNEDKHQTVETERVLKVTKL